MKNINSQSEILFEETQRFTQWWLWWLWLTLIGINGLILYGIYRQLILGIPFGDKPAPDGVLIAVEILMLVLTISFAASKLETQIRKDGIYIRFFPFHFSVRQYLWSDIEKAFVRKYKPISEYGGWGLRGLGKSKALNVSGNKGLQLELKADKKLLIGTQKPEQMEEVLRKLRHK